MGNIFLQAKKILKEKKLEAEVPTDESALVDDRRFLVIPCRQRGGKKWLFKIQYLDKPQIGSNFLNEVYFLKLAKKYKEIAPHVPLMSDFGWVEGKVWYLREFIDGQMLGKDEDTFPYDPAILSRLEPMTVAKFFYNLAKIPLTEVLEATPNIKRYDLRWRTFHQEFLKDHPAILKLKEKRMDYFTKEEQGRLFNLLLNPPKTILSPQSWALNHANLSPTNIFFRPPKDLLFIDWENVCWGFRTSGFGEFWYRSFTSPDFQEEFFESRLGLEEEKVDFLRVFYFSMVVGDPGLVDYLTSLYRKTKIEKTLYERAIKILTKTIREGMEAFGA